jgi:predicted kinase
MSVPLADVIMCHGFQGSGKSTYIKNTYTKGCVGTTNTYTDAIIISNDISKKALADFEEALKENKLIVIDNTHLTKKSRGEYLSIANKNNKTVDLLRFNSSIEDCQIRVLHRQWQKFGRFFLK